GLLLVVRHRPSWKPKRPTIGHKSTRVPGEWLKRPRSVGHLENEGIARPPSLSQRTPSELGHPTGVCHAMRKVLWTALLLTASASCGESAPADSSSTFDDSSGDPWR